jgi:hypothetical protein
MVVVAVVRVVAMPVRLAQVVLDYQAQAELLQQPLV